MKAQRKIIVYIATSADGYIARPDGDVEGLNRRPRTVDYGIAAFYPTIDTILWGRKTYDWVLAYYKKKGRKSGMFDTKLANYVFSRKPPKRATPGVEFVSESVKGFAQRLRATPGSIPGRMTSRSSSRCRGRRCRSSTASNRSPRSTGHHSCSSPCGWTRNNRATSTRPAVRPPRAVPPGRESPTSGPTTGP